MDMSKKYCYFSSMKKNVQEIIQYRQAKSLIDNGFKVINVVSDNKSTEFENGVEIISSGFVAKNYIQRLILAPWKLYKKLKEIDADIYHTVHIDQLLLCLLLKLRGKKVIVEIQESHPYTYYYKSTNPEWIKKIVFSILKFYMKATLKKVDYILTPSQDIHDYLVDWGLDETKINVFGNFPIINQEYKLTKEEYMNRDNRILYFGIIYSFSRQEIFLKALSNFPDVKYLVAGKFMGNESYSYKPFLTNLAEWQKVEFIEGFSHSELKDFINRSTISNVLRDFSVFKTTKQGSLGIIKIFESMEAALPIICTDLPLYRSIINKYKCGILVDPLNPEEIKDAIEYLITHKEEAWEMGQRGRQAVIEEYSWDALSVKYIKLVNSLLN